MAEDKPQPLEPEKQLLLDQPLLRMPHELSRKTFAIARREVDREQNNLNKVLANNTSDPLGTLDSAITRMMNMKRKLEGLHAEEKALHRQSRARIEHLNTLYQIPTVVDVKFDDWSRVRLNRLLVDYLLRNGYEQSARQLAEEKGIEELVDVEAFVACHRIEKSLKQGRTQECLSWCVDNNKDLKKINSELQFELRLQQYIELIRSGKLYDATVHARKYLITHSDTASAIRAAGLLAFPPDTEAEPYKALYSPARWTHLANLFIQEHHKLFSLPSRPLLHIALSAGLSALKTPACHSQYASSSSNASSTATSVCPICSTELNLLARNVPYAHHAKSHVEADPVVLPNGRIYGRDRLREANEKLGTEKGWMRDLTNRGEIFEEDKVKKVYIS